jgi:two-component system, NtrC family, response regulator HydG
MRQASLGDIIGESPALSMLLDMVRIIAPKDITVLIHGERGTGKELIADAIHALSARCSMPFVKVNCAVLNRELLASELFGHVKGSFTGATDTRMGLITSAQSGTLFLDEIGDLCLDAQASLLRFLQEGEVRPVGSLATLTVDVRVICATNKNLEESIEKGAFREDLYDRLNGFPLKVPPLRDRREDIPLLAEHFVQRYNAKYKETVAGFTKEAMRLLMDYPWNGNVRELEHVVSRAVVLSQGKRRITPGDLSDILPSHGMKLLMNPNQERILALVKRKGKVSVKDIQPSLRISDRAIRKHLHQMVEFGLLKKEGGKRNTWFRLL